MKAAIVGLGLIGSEWAKNLQKDGVLAACWNRSGKAGFSNCLSDLSEIPTAAEVIHVVVSDEVATLGVISTLAPQINSAHLLIQSTTIDPETSSRARALVEQQGAQYLEAPFTGSLPAAQARQTIFMLGGKEEVIERARPYLSSLGSDIFVIGDNEQACTYKLSMNLLIASAMQSLSEALTICRGRGIGDEKFFEAFKKNAAYSGVAKLKEAKLKTYDYSPQFSIKHLAKDLRLLDSSLSKKLPLLEAISCRLKAAVESGIEEEDISALVKLL